MSSEWDSDELDEAWTDEDYSDESDYSDNCPECGAVIYDDADVCPQCGFYIIHSNSVWQGKSTLWIVLGLLGIIAVIGALSVF